ncbi:heme-dependent catalase [Fusarium longipes]|uniref:Heme-dependent catalase n=1 Tax=Fusarium longipes TaxID=694270 RepID=A0A395T7U5_9HYPO|nr:heme-dependent catalase [Fusarium longipes]
MSTRNYIRWDAEGVEKIPPDEEQDIKEIVKKINESQRRFYEKNGYCYTGTHARTQGIVRGTLVVSDDLPPHLKQTELFAQAGEFPVIFRYSSEPSDPKLDDRIPQPRGLAMKVFNVRGAMFEAGQDFPTQDIEFNSTPALDLADAKTTKEIMDLRLKHGYNTKEQHEKIEQRLDKELQQARNQVPNQHLEAITFYSQTAYRFGDYVVKYNLVPNTEAQKRRSETVDKQPDGVLSEWLYDFYLHNQAEYLFQVQLLENLEEQPVEYGGTEWDSDKYPWQTVAKIVLPKQDSWNEERNDFWQDHLRVDPWHGLVSFQPLGSPNRLRRVLYPASSSFRRKINKKEEINVKSIDEIPGY